MIRRWARRCGWRTKLRGIGYAIRLPIHDILRIEEVLRFEQVLTLMDGTGILSMIEFSGQCILVAVVTVSADALGRGIWVYGE